jgi:hypothetical protein
VLRHEKEDLENFDSDLGHAVLLLSHLIRVLDDLSNLSDLVKLAKTAKY